MLKSKINQYVKNLCNKALIASKLAALNTNKDRNNILKSIANNLDKDRKNIEKSNSIDINNAYKKKINRRNIRKFRRFNAFIFGK